MQFFVWFYLVCFLICRVLLSIPSTHWPFPLYADSALFDCSLLQRFPSICRNRISLHCQVLLSYSHTATILWPLYCSYALRWYLWTGSDFDHHWRKCRHSTVNRPNWRSTCSHIFGDMVCVLVHRSLWDSLLILIFIVSVLTISQLYRLHDWRCWRLLSALMKVFRMRLMLVEYLY